MCPRPLDDLVFYNSRAGFEPASYPCAQCRNRTDPSWVEARHATETLITQFRKDFASIMNVTTHLVCIYCHLSVVCFCYQTASFERRQNAKDFHCAICFSSECCCGGWDSNPHMSAYETAELPVLYPAI